MKYPHSRKAFLVKLPGTESMVIIPIDPLFPDVFVEDSSQAISLEILKIGTKIEGKPISSFCVYKEYQGLDALGNEGHSVDDLSSEDYQKILDNNGICYIQCDDQQGTIYSQRGLHDCKVIIHLESPEAIRLVVSKEGGWFSFNQFPAEENSEKKFAVMDEFGNVDHCLQFREIVRSGNYIKDYWLPKGYVWQYCEVL